MGLFRHFENRRQLAAYAGLAPSPWKSGSIDHEQGISKAGNPRLRTTMVELAWMWVRYQPDSALSGWFRRRVGLERGRTSHLDRSARPQTAHRPVEICHPWRDPGGRCHEASLRHPGKRNQLSRVPRGLISRVGSGRAGRRKQWLRYAEIQCGPTLPSPMTSRMRDCGASRSENGDRM